LYASRLLYEKEYASSVVETYLKKLKTAYNWLGKKFPTVETAYEYVYWLKDQGKSASHVNNTAYALELFLELFYGVKVKIPKKKAKKKELSDEDVLTPEEIKRLFKVCRGFKDYAMVAVLIYGGLRPRELRLLRWKDILWDVGEIKVRNSKNRVVDTREAHKKCFRALKRWREHSPCPGENDYVFIDKYGKPYNRKNFWKYMHQRFVWAGIKKRVYALRHTHATILIERSGDLFFVKNQMGHRNIQSTMRYLHFVNKANRKKKYQEAMPDLEK